MVTPGRIGCGGSRLSLRAPRQLVGAAVGALVLAWTATGRAQTPAPPPAPTPETIAASTSNEILLRHLHLLTPEEPTPEGILAPERPSQLAAPLLRRANGTTEPLASPPPQDETNGQEIRASLATLQAAVGGYIEAVDVPRDASLVLLVHEDDL